MPLMSRNPSFHEGINRKVATGRATLLRPTSLAHSQAQPLPLGLCLSFIRRHRPPRGAGRASSALSVKNTFHVKLRKASSTPRHGEGWCSPEGTAAGRPRLGCRLSKVDNVESRLAPLRLSGHRDLSFPS
uniref:Uncharacterized protein n=1 Tax=Pipistrellus kuhlii TaxID=59472 RepID=A0A7J7ZJD5_PIPKU|nr:hypothetical protein mPipKuh1_009384 [Pipistrellus kuhlii]